MYSSWLQRPRALTHFRQMVEMLIDGLEPHAHGDDAGMRAAGVLPTFKFIDDTVDLKAAAFVLLHNPLRAEAVNLAAVFL